VARSRRLAGFVALSAAVSTAGLVAIWAGSATASLAWDDDPCEENGGQVAVAPDVSVQQGDDHPLAYVACGDGTLLYHGWYGKGSYERIPGVEADQFVDVSATPADNLYAVTVNGRIRSVGGVHYGDIYPSSVRVVALETTPTGNGYWIVREDGRVYGFGDARSMGPSKTTVVHSAIVAFTARSATGGWVVTANGEVVPVGSAPNYGSVTRLLAYGDRAVGIVTDRRSGGFWVTTRQGDIIPAGGAPAEPDAAACLDRPGAQPPFAGAVGDPDVDAPAPLWTYSVNGGICGFNPYR
jgi:hypothetical protein